jgi:pilus assembly protein Flp/PilA
MEMKTALWNIYVRMEALLSKEDGQDLIEYALVVALIAFAATAGMSSVATAINTGFGNIANTLSTYTG